MPRRRKRKLWSNDEISELSNLLTSGKSVKFCARHFKVRDENNIYAIVRTRLGTTVGAIRSQTEVAAPVMLKTPVKAVVDSIHKRGFTEGFEAGRQDALDEFMKLAA